MYLVPLQLGFDYFSGALGDATAIRVPYLDHSVPDFAEASQAYDNQRCADAAMTDAILIGLIAYQVAAHPKLWTEAGSKSEAEIARELSHGLQAALRDPEAKARSREMLSALNELRPLTGSLPLPQPKPLWRFW